MPSYQSWSKDLGTSVMRRAIFAQYIRQLGHWGSLCMKDSVFVTSEACSSFRINEGKSKKVLSSTKYMITNCEQAVFLQLNSFQQQFCVFIL